MRCQLANGDAQACIPPLHRASTRDDRDMVRFLFSQRHREKHNLYIVETNMKAQNLLGFYLPKTTHTQMNEIWMRQEPAATALRALH